MTDRRPLIRMIAALLLSAFLVGPVGRALADLGERGGPDLFPFLVLAVGFLLREVSAQAERLALGMNRKPWLGGRLRRHQRLILPSATATILPLGFAAAIVGGRFLNEAPPGWSAANVVAIGCVILGGLLQGFALARLLVGGLVIRFSGLWGAPRRAWLIGGAVIALGCVANAAYSVENTMRAVTWF